MLGGVTGFIIFLSSHVEHPYIIRKAWKHW